MLYGWRCDALESSIVVGYAAAETATLNYSEVPGVVAARRCVVRPPLGRERDTRGRRITC